FLHPLMSCRVVGTFTTTYLFQLAYSRPSRSMPSRSVESTSTLTGPFTTSQISLMSGLLFCLFSFAISEGLVVTPSRIPRAAASRISLMLAVSIKNFMARPFVFYAWGADRGDSTPRPACKPCRWFVLRLVENNVLPGLREELERFYVERPFGK